jgi:cytochrome c peroxidase
MSILNSSLAKFLTWSGEVRTLKDQIKNSIEASHKLNMSKEEVEKRLNRNYDEVINSLEVYVKTLLTRSSFDRFLEGDNNAINTNAKQGLVDFMNFGCSGCHTGMSVGGQSVQRFPLRNFAGIHDLRPNLGPPPEFKIIDNTFPFVNKGEYMGRAGTSFFRVPILRNVTKTSPYFHNGSVDKIRKAVEIMGRHQVGINLTNVQIDNIVAFLKTLEGNIVDYENTNNIKGDVK